MHKENVVIFFSWIGFAVRAILLLFSGPFMPAVIDSIYWNYEEINFLRICNQTEYIPKIYKEVSHLKCSNNSLVIRMHNQNTIKVILLREKKS